MEQRESHAACAVVGGANVDITARAFAPLLQGDSNPGRLRFSLGGVGRNIAHNLSLLGVQTQLVTALGADELGSRIVNSCHLNGISLAGSLRLEDAATSAYLSIGDPEGETALAVADMEICARLTPDALFPALETLCDKPLVVLEANLPEETILWLARNLRVPLYADTVSTPKAPRLQNALGRLHTLKTNRVEAERLSGVAIRDERSLERAAESLLETGLRRVFLTLGSEGVLAAEGRVRLRLRGERVAVQSSTGCGDAFLAGVVWQSLRGGDLETCARAGLAAAELTLASDEAVNPAMSPENIQSKLSQYRRITHE